MNKTELITKLAKKTGLTQAKAADAVDIIFNAHKGIIASELGANRKVTLPGFGSFLVRKRAAREGRNPATGKSIRIPARAYPAFKVGKTMKEKVAK
ncbi:MAG: HU family DNA-binding protein [Acidobacteriota bacterium]